MNNLPPANPAKQTNGDAELGIPVPFDDDEIEEALREIEQDPVPTTSTRDISDQSIRASTINVLLVTFMGTILLSFISFWIGKSSSEIKDLLELLLPAETALLGTAVGFYYGTRKE